MPIDFNAIVEDERKKFAAGLTPPFTAHEKKSDIKALAKEYAGTPMEKTILNPKGFKYSNTFIVPV